ncbi:MAG: hypothetical protein ACQSGP_08960 [Frankia sp.]
MTVPPSWRVPWDILGREISPLPAGTSLERRMAPLLENLARATGTGYAALWLPPGPPIPASAPRGIPTNSTVPRTSAKPEEGSGWTVLLSRQAAPGAGPPAALRAGPARSIAALSDRPGVRALVGVPHDGQTVCVIMIGDPDNNPGDPDNRPGGPHGGPSATVPRELLDQTRDCVALLLREGRLAAALRGQLTRADRLAEWSARVEADLTSVRDVERQRLAGWVLAGTTRQLAAVTRRWEDLASVVRTDSGHALGALRSMRRAADDLIDDFRTVVRAVHPSMLRSQGTAAALRELAARLPGGVHVAGDLGRRVGWEVESGLYHAAAAALTAMHETGGGDLTMLFTRANGRLAVRLNDRSARSLGQLRAGLADDARRMRALGGDLTCHVSAPGGRMIEIWLPERLSGMTGAA